MVKIKICGVTNVSDALQAVNLGADAVGLNFFEGSPRFVTMAKAAEISAELPPFVEPVAVFVKTPILKAKSALAELGLRTFQCHGDTLPERDLVLDDYCKQFLRANHRQVLSDSIWANFQMISGIAVDDLKKGEDNLGITFPTDVRPLRPIPAFGVQGLQSLQWISTIIKRCHDFGQLPAAILVDAHVPGSYGGTGQALPWELLADFSPGVPLILAGGLNADNVARAIRLVRPYAVDVASSVESAPGKKDADKMKRFIDAVRVAV